MEADACDKAEVPGILSDSEVKEVPQKTTVSEVPEDSLRKAGAAESAENPAAWLLPISESQKQSNEISQRRATCPAIAQDANVESPMPPRSEAIVRHSAPARPAEEEGLARLSKTSNVSLKSAHSNDHLQRFFSAKGEKAKLMRQSTSKSIAASVPSSMFDQLDVDGSGLLTKEEMKNYIMVTGLRPENLDSLLDEALLQADMDGDGCLNEEEFENFFLKIIKDAPRPSFMAKHRFWIEALLVVLFFLAAPIIYCNTEDGWSIWDALYFAAVTLTTVGYGDFSPSSDGMRLFTIFYMLIGLIIVWSVFDAAVTRFVAAYQRHMEFLHTQVTKKVGDVRNSDLDCLTPNSRERAKNCSFRWQMCRKAFFLILLVILLLTVGTLVISVNEGWSWFHGIYWSVVTATTVGYGDLTLTKESSRIFAMFFVLTGFAVASCVVGELAAMKLQWDEHRHCQELMARSLSLNIFADLIKDGHSLDRCAFVTAMLMQMGKVTEDDINPLLQKFDELDTDGDMMLTPLDVQHMQHPSRTANADTFLH